MKPAFRTLAVVLAVCLIGCLPFGLGDPEKASVDDKLIGLWLSQDDASDTALYQILPYDSRTYLISGYNFSREGDKIEAGERFTAKAWLHDVKGKRFITLKVLSASHFFKPAETMHLVARIDMDAGKLTARPVSPDAVNDGKVESSEALEKFLADKLDEEDTYLKAQTFEKLSPERYVEAKTILKAFGEDYGD